MSSEQVLYTQADIQNKIQEIATITTPQMSDDDVVVALMNGAMVFAADFLRALYAKQVNPIFESLRLHSYGDAQTSSGQITVHGEMKRSVKDRRVWVLDDVFDSGQTLAFAVDYIKKQGASDVKSIILLRKPWPQDRPMQPDYVGFDAPSQFLLGYGMDDQGRSRGQAHISAI